MRIFKLPFITLLLTVMGFCAIAQSETPERQQWIKANLYDKKDAVDFIETAYREFTPVIAKKTTETGIYKLKVTIHGCELVIETQSRKQESAWKSDHEYKNDLVVIELDKIALDGNDITPGSPENANGLFAGHNFDHTKKIPSYSILTPVINKDDAKFARLHYEQHLQWAFQFLIEQCGKH